MSGISSDDRFGVTAVLENIGMIIRGVHVRGTAGRCLDTYVDPDVLFEYPWSQGYVSQLLAQMCWHMKPDVIVGLETGGDKLACSIGYFLENVRQSSRQPQLRAFTAHKMGKGAFRIAENRRPLLDGQRVLVVDDILTTGSSLKGALTAVREAGGNVVGAAVLWNRGGVTKKDLGIPQLVSLIETQLLLWHPAACPLCQRGIPYTERLGHPKKS